MRKAIQAFALITLAPLVVGLAALVSPGIGLAQSPPTQRPLSDFLDEQGTFNQPPIFFPPVLDYAGWADGDFTTFALVDYAGLAAQYIDAAIGLDLGTEFSGYVRERETQDGEAEITVRLDTTNALTFAQSIAALEANGFNFAETPTIFGSTALCVVDDSPTWCEEGAEPVVGSSSLRLRFTISEPGAPLPDFLAILADPASYAPVWFNFKAEATVMNPDGESTRLRVHQVASTTQSGELKFSVEIVDIKDIGKPNIAE